MSLFSSVVSSKSLPVEKLPRIRSSSPSCTNRSSQLPFSCISFLKHCRTAREFSPIHAQLITTNLIQDPYIAINVLWFLISTKDLDYAGKTLHHFNEPDVTICNSVMEDKLSNESPHDLLVTYNFMVTKRLALNLSSFHFLIRACSTLCDVQRGREVHGRILKFGAGRNKCLNNNLMGMYVKCGEFEDAVHLFDKMPHRDVVSWNTMISCYVQFGLYSKALILFEEMVVNGIQPDEITVISLLSACAKLRDLEMGIRLHRYAEENDLEIEGSLLNCLVDMYVKCEKMEMAHELLLERCDSEVDDVLQTTLISGYMKSKEIDKAKHVFEQVTCKNLITWTTMISGYTQYGYHYETLYLFTQMRNEDFFPDEGILVMIISACAHLKDYKLGRSIHGLILQYGIIIDGILGNTLIEIYVKSNELDNAVQIFNQLPLKSTVTWNSLLNGFCRNGDSDRARSFFNEIPEKDVVSWNTMINCYAKCSKLRESFELFNEMQSSTVKPDELTLVSLLTSCASAGVLNYGIWVHTYIKKNQVGVSNILATALLDMYGKCGNVNMAYQLFSDITEKDVFVWTAIVSAYAMDGQAEKAIELFSEMEDSGVKPDHVTFISLLSACSHGGLVNKGYEYLNKMKLFYYIPATIQHYGCMVDLLGRVGKLEVAVNFIKNMQVNPDISIWSSLLRASLSHENIEVAEYAFEQLVEIDPTNDAAYLQMSSIYKKMGRLDDASRMRRKLHGMGVRKQPGCSMIEHNGDIHEFFANDCSHSSRLAEIYALLDDIGIRLKIKELQEESRHHSERLAVAFGILSSAEKSLIRVVNNLRICGDCHTAMKLISDAYDREIVIRDNYRFHRFRNGCCSCKDFW